MCDCKNFNEYNGQYTSVLWRIFFTDASYPEENKLQDHMKGQIRAALAAASSGRKMLDCGRQFYIHQIILRQRLKLNLTGGRKTWKLLLKKRKESCETTRWNLSDKFYGKFDRVTENFLRVRWTKTCES
jgi:hypothetical protein